MNVLIIASWYPSEENPLNGVFFQQRAKALAKEECRVTVFFTDVRFNLKGAKKGITESTEDNVRVYRYVKWNKTPFCEAGVAYQKIAMVKKLYRMAFGQEKPDLIQLESAHNALAAVALSKKMKIPLFYTEHSSKMLISQKGTLHRRLLELASKNAQYTFWISRAMKEKVSTYCKQGEMLPNAIDFSQFTLVSAPEEFCFCALGSLRKIKGFDILLRAFHEVLKRFPNCKLIIGGDGEESEALHMLCDDLNLNNAVVFGGWVNPEKRNQFYQCASAFVCSSYVETFSIVTIEALACGVPVVATKCGGPEDIIDDTNGYLVEKGNMHELANGMMKMVESRSHFDSKLIRQNAYLRYSEDSVVKRQMDCYKRLIK